MNKWIAEFELEDRDTMPEHMDLEYKGVKIDFHCRPQEQEPTDKKFTKADIDAIVKAINKGWELRVNEVLNKVRTEIENLPIAFMRAGEIQKGALKIRECKFQCV